MNHFIFCSMLAPGDGSASFSQTNLLCTHFYRTLDSESKHRIFHFLSAEKKITGPSLCPFIHMLHTCTNMHTPLVWMFLTLCKGSFIVESTAFLFCLPYPDTHPHIKFSMVVSQSSTNASRLSNVNSSS